MGRFHSSRLALALLTVLASGPAVATACAMLCAPALHKHAAAHQGAAACHHAIATQLIVAAAPDHDCRTHLGAARDVLATLTPLRHLVDRRDAPAVAAMAARVLTCTYADSYLSHAPPPDPVFLPPAPLILRI